MEQTTDTREAAAAPRRGIAFVGEQAPRRGTAIAAAAAGEIVTTGGERTRSAHRATFAFGDPETVLDRRDLWGYAQCQQVGQWYEPPVPMAALARTYRMSPHHQSALIYKRNQLLRFFRPSRWLSAAEFGKLALEYLAMGNGYLERRDNLAGRPIALLNTPAKYTRVGIEDGVYWWVPGWKSEMAFRPGRVFHLREHDLDQEIYGLPEWLSAIQSGLLNESATIFRRRYYANGSHAGYILYINEESFSEADADELADQLDQSKGPGNFRNLLMHIPKGKEKGVQVIPVGEASAKDEFFNIKQVTRDDLLAAHRVPPVLIGVVPQVNGGFGKPSEAADAFHFAEIEPLQARFREVNDWMGVEAVAFDPYQRQTAAPAA